jgi:hypothetical protein
VAWRRPNGRAGVPRWRCWRAGSGLPGRRARR